MKTKIPNFYLLLLIIMLLPVSNTSPKSKKAHQENENKVIFIQKKKNQNTDPVTESKRCITVINTIEPKMLEYKHWTGCYNPSSFRLQVNNVELKQGAQQQFEITDNKLIVRYDYSFLNNFKTGAKIITFLVDEEKDKVAITFSWTDTWHVLIDGGTPQSAESCTFESHEDRK